MPCASLLLGYTIGVLGFMCIQCLHPDPSIWDIHLGVVTNFISCAVPTPKIRQCRGTSCSAGGNLACTGTDKPATSRLVATRTACTVGMHRRRKLWRTTSLTSLLGGAYDVEQTIPRDPCCSSTHACCGTSTRASRSRSSSSSSKASCSAPGTSERKP